MPSIAWCPEPLGWGPLPLGIVVFSLSPQGAAPGPLSLSAPRGHRKRGAGPEKGARSLKELRKAHLLTITGQASAITSCRERQDVCLGVAACGSTTARVCPSLPEPEVSSGSSHRGSEGEEHFPFRTHPGRTRVEAGRAALLEGRSPGAGRAALPEGRSPGVPPTTPGETLSTFPGSPSRPASASTSAAAALRVRDH